AEEVRQLNNDYASGGEGYDMPVPATARVVENTYRFAAAFARLHLRDRIAAEDVARAKSLAKQLIAQSWDGEKFHGSPASGAPSSEKDQVEALISAIQENDGLAYGDLTDATGMDAQAVDTTLEKVRRQGQVYEPETDFYRVVA
ncbi:MAG: hypothetical protein ACNS61_02275, partial [Candidatus Wenzhouxiangella sp. M2_3B_020]